MTAPSARPVTVCASPKGGQGCTTIAAVLAVLAARSSQPTLLLDTRGDAAAILGVSDPAPASTVADAIANAVAPCDRLRVVSVAGDWIDTDAISAISELFAAGYRVIVDTGTDHDVLHRFDPLSPQRLLVTRPCYVALRRAIGVPFVPDHVVLIAEHQRSLTEREVSLALTLPVTSVPYDPAIARAIDAGLLAARLPRCLANAIAQLPV
ncbi:MAG: hypothetical protein HY828_06320 [Actinobacteria bacterium]|nr:hypothetical protein [Actinomycetota bacterium]